MTVMSKAKRIKQLELRVSELEGTLSHIASCRAIGNLNGVFDLINKIEWWHQAGAPSESNAGIPQEEIAANTRRAYRAMVTL